jgi:hypothetical protein
MNYSIARSHEIRRLSYEQMISLKVYEKNAQRCLMPWEIQERFNLPPLKATYLIPEVEAAQASHTARIQGDFYQQKIYPTFLYLGSLDIDKAHEFDRVVSESNVDFIYSGAGQKKTKFRDLIDE